MQNHTLRKTKKKVYRGTTLVLVMIFGSVSFVIIVLGLLGFALFEYQSSLKIYRRDVAFHISEAGIEYYRWHLAHNPNDFSDGTGGYGPYTHSVRDKFDIPVGNFSLSISTVPNSSVVMVSATGTVEQGSSNRAIRVRLGFQSFTDYAFVQNGNMYFSFTTEVHGTVHSNGGIRFDGVTDSWVRSAKDTYQYQNQTHSGVWGAGGPKSFWEYPVPAVDFGSLTGDLAATKSAAQEGGSYFLASGKEGWQLVFRDTVYDVYKVNTVDCYYGEGRWRRRFGQWYWEGTSYCFDIGTRTLQGTYPLPENGVIFLEDNTWIEGTVDGRVTIGVGKFPVPGEFKKVFISNNLLQKQKSGDDVIGIITQGDIVVPYEAPSTLEINAAAISQYGKIYTPYYNEAENPGALKNSLSYFGSLISYESGGWKYINGWGHVISGYVNTSHSYDGNLKYYAPAGFPIGSTYELVSWEEMK